MCIAELVVFELSIIKIAELVEFELSIIKIDGELDCLDCLNCREIEILIV